MRRPAPMQAVLAEVTSAPVDYECSYSICSIIGRWLRDARCEGLTQEQYIPCRPAVYHDHFRTFMARPILHSCAPRLALYQSPERYQYMFLMNCSGRYFVMLACRGMRVEQRQHVLDRAWRSLLKHTRF